jgi:hypothetical protein
MLASFPAVMCRRIVLGETLRRVAASLIETVMGLLGIIRGPRGGCRGTAERILKYMMNYLVESTQGEGPSRGEKRLLFEGFGRVIGGRGR